MNLLRKMEIIYDEKTDIEHRPFNSDSNAER